MKIQINREISDDLYNKIFQNESRYTKEQFYLGLNVELEHGSENQDTNITNDNLELTAKIVVAHLNEIPNYYDYLSEVEKRYEENLGKTVLITGGSDGLGKEIAIELSKNYKVIVTGLDPNKLANLKKEFLIDYFVCDVTDYSASKNMIENIIEKYGKIDVLINNAGILYEGESFEMSEEQISKLIDINIKGVEYMCSLVSKNMTEKNSGLIINVISQSGLYHRRARSLYNSSKWALTGFTKCLASDLSKYNIKVTGFYPGKMNTKIFENTSINPKDRSLDPKIAAKVVRFVIELNGDAYIPEIGLKSIIQDSVDEISY